MVRGRRRLECGLRRYGAFVGAADGNIQRYGGWMKLVRASYEDVNALGVGCVKETGEGDLATEQLREWGP